MFDFAHTNKDAQIWLVLRECLIEALGGHIRFTEINTASSMAPQSSISQI